MIFAPRIHSLLILSQSCCSILLLILGVFFLSTGRFLLLKFINHLWCGNVFGSQLLFILKVSHGFHKEHWLLGHIYDRTRLEVIIESILLTRGGAVATSLADFFDTISSRVLLLLTGNMHLSCVARRALLILTCIHLLVGLLHHLLGGRVILLVIIWKLRFTLSYGLFLAFFHSSANNGWRNDSSEGRVSHFEKVAHWRQRGHIAPHRVFLGLGVRPGPVLCWFAAHAVFLQVCKREIRVFARLGRRILLESWHLLIFGDILHFFCAGTYLVQWSPTENRFSKLTVWTLFVRTQRIAITREFHCLWHWLRSRTICQSLSFTHAARDNFSAWWDYMCILILQCCVFFGLL